jgi:methionyl-tRNA formyltransferase
MIGASHFGLRCLERCLQMPPVSVVGVVTAPRTFAISYRPSGVTNVLHADLAAVAAARGIPVLTQHRSMNEQGMLQTVQSWRPDAFLVAGWYHIVPRRWREVAHAYGLHASLLPDYSGGAPLVWAMINGESRTGITLFQMDDGVDSGPIAAQAEVPIRPDDTIATLYARIEERGIELLGFALPKLADGTLQLRTQDESRRRVVPQRAPEDGRIDWTQDAIFVQRFIRAQTRPYPGSFTSLNGATLHIWRAEVAAEVAPVPPIGSVVRTRGGEYLVACGHGAIRLDEVSYGSRDYAGDQLASVFGGGAQRLGSSETE